MGASPNRGSYHLGFRLHFRLLVLGLSLFHSGKVFILALEGTRLFLIGLASCSKHN